MRRLVVLLVLLVPTFVSAQSIEWLQDHPGATTVTMGQASTTVSVSAAPLTPAPVATNDGLEQTVRAFFYDNPIMAEIARCESRFRQFDSVGNALDGGAGGMIGLFQINSTVHTNFAKSLGMNIYAVDGNMAYAKYLYQHEGTDPWLSSFSCWHNAQSSNALPNTLTQDLILGTISMEVKALQIMLNSKGYKLADSGPGSPGEETEKFGSLTRAALRKFQCAVMQICSGNEHETEYGMVGAKTRAAIVGDNVATALPSQSEADQVAALQKQIQELTAQLFALKQKFAMQ